MTDLELEILKWKLVFSLLLGVEVTFDISFIVSFVYLVMVNNLEGVEISKIWYNL